MYAPLLLLLVPAVAPRLLHTLPDDPHAFPKYRVAFLNSLPVLNHTAQRWLHEGLRGGELEFQDQPWKDLHPHHHSSRKEIGSGGSHEDPYPSDPRVSFRLQSVSQRDPDHSHLQQPTDPDYALELMKMGNKDAYICLIPKAPEAHGFPEEHDAEADITPARSWSLLQPLTGTCLYHRQGWFTYSYCHNEEIRQFKELVPSHAHVRASGAYKPEEDPEWESYTLGRAPVIPEPGADLTLAERNAQAANLELARNAGSRYLVQRWGDGTICDKTGKPREVEVQFHCSMTMTDTILFVKEAKTCSYVLVINTPRLCGEPGFKSRRDSGEEALIRCREIVDSPMQAESGLPITDYPLKFPPRKHVLPSPQQVPKDPSADSIKAKEKLLKDVKHAIDALGSIDDAIIFEFDDMSEDDPEEQTIQILEAFRAAGYDVRSEVITDNEKKDNMRRKENGNVKSSDGGKVGSTNDRNDNSKGKMKKFVFNHREEL